MSTDLQSPVTEAKIESLQELFDKDPMDLSEQDIDRIVLELRKARVEFIEKEKAPKKAKIQPPSTPLSLTDLGI